MKKTNFITGSFLVLFTVLLISCSGGSVKGNWSDADKEKARKELSSEGAPEEWVECMVSKCEAKFESFESADADEEGAVKLAEECMDEVFSNGSVLGNWSDSDKESFRADMLAEGVDDSEFTECYLSKCEAAYKSYFHANADESDLAVELAAACALSTTEEEVTE